MTEKKLIPESLIVVPNFEKFTSIKAGCDQSQPNVSERCGL